MSPDPMSTVSTGGGHVSGHVRPPGGSYPWTTDTGGQSNARSDHLCRAAVTSTSGWHRKDHSSAASQARAAQYRTPAYKAARAALKGQIDAGLGSCWRCGRWIAPGSAWHVGHDDNDRSVIRGAEHAGENLKAGASKGARIANARRKSQRQPPTPPPYKPPPYKPSQEW